MRTRHLLSTIALLALVACGGGASPPRTAQPDTAGASAPGASSGDAGAQADDEIKPFAGIDVEPPPSASASPSAPPAPGASEPNDDCTPASVDFEKRVRPKLKECYREGKKKEPDLRGTVKITVAIDTLGKIKSTKVTEKTLPDPVAKCMLDAVKKAGFPEAAKCPGKEISIPMTFPSR